ncbi:DUF4129 domain-containing protein [Allosalinactinospora lopnorensis]|uniref:DUF4129 domain-containing protein n=1 Tax=Allosalinactinospora lopnorensis TaxID=1352348 RepID=UPI00308444FA
MGARAPAGPAARSADPAGRVRAPVPAGAAARRRLRHRRPLTAADHRAAADTHAATGEYAAAIRERLRAIARELEERAILPPRPGRTATELAAEAAATLPPQRDALYRAAAVFNDIAYGERPATADGDRFLRELDERLRETRPVGNGGRSE